MPKCASSPAAITTTLDCHRSNIDLLNRSCGALSPAHVRTEFARLVRIAPPMPQAMTFNAELAHQIAYKDSPRDKARYFEGREHEITQFLYGLAASEDRDQAIFRIYQGAPGCGKTSLANHLAETTEDAVFIKLQDRHLTDFHAMMRHIPRRRVPSRRALRHHGNALGRCRRRTAGRTRANQ